MMVPPLITRLVAISAGRSQPIGWMNWNGWPMSEKALWPESSQVTSPHKT
jgi:hypothetical protein